MPVIARRFHDRAGNNLFQYCFARAYAECYGCELQTDPWWGQRVFGLTEKPISKELPKRSDWELEKWDGQTDIEITFWGMSQKNLIYSRAAVRQWLQFTPEMEELLKEVRGPNIACHLRWGDFKEMADYIAVSIGSYERAIAQFLPNEEQEYQAVCSWSPVRNKELELMGLDWLADFVTLMRAKYLFRANSTFSWWTGTLGNAERIFSPDLHGITPRAGEIQDAPFEEGNHSQLSQVHYNHSTLYLTP